MTTDLRKLFVALAPSWLLAPKSALVAVGVELDAEGALAPSAAASSSSVLLRLSGGAPAVLRHVG